MNKKERMQAVFSKQIPDHVPAGFWFHYPSEWDAAPTAEAHLKLYRETGMDIIKIMDDCFGCAVTENVKITKASDWKAVTLPGKNCRQYKKMEEVIRIIAGEVGDEVMLFPTMWSPFKIACFAYHFGGSSEAAFMRDCREDPESILCGLETITRVLLEWADGYLEAGASGIYFSGQFSEPQRFTDEEWRRLVMPSDLAVLNHVKSKNAYNIVHICGESEFDFATTPQRYKDYPGDMFNWATHHNKLTLEEGRELFGTAILGGVDNHGALVNGSAEEIRAEVKAVIETFGKRGFMLGADCTVPSTINTANIKAAVDAAVSF